jgi:hypothetical protein
MQQPDLRPRLELQLTVLATRIAELREKMKTAAGQERIEECGEITALERRYTAIKDRLRDRDQEGGSAVSGRRRNSKPWPTISRARSAIS